LPLIKQTSVLFGSASKKAVYRYLRQEIILHQLFQKLKNIIPLEIMDDIIRAKEKDGSA